MFDYKCPFSNSKNGRHNFEGYIIANEHEQDNGFQIVRDKFEELQGLCEWCGQKSITLQALMSMKRLENKKNG